MNFNLTITDADIFIPKDKLKEDVYHRLGFKYQPLPNKNSSHITHLQMKRDQEIVIKLETLEELLNLIKAVDQVVIYPSFDSEQEFDIEIYNGWRE